MIRARNGFLIAILFAVALPVWAGAFHGVFQLDDFASILRDPSFADAGQFLSEAPHRIRPLTRLTFLLDRHLYGIAPAGWHVLNLLLHLGSGLLLFSLGSRLAGGRVLGFWTALLFLVHPITTEAVTYVSGRPTVLAAFLILLALDLYDRATPDGPGGRRRTTLWLASLACFALANGAKETAVALPLLLLVWDAVGRGARGPVLRRAVVRDHAAFWGVLLAVATVSLAVPRYRELLASSLALRSPLENLVAQARALPFALALLVRPGWMNVDHDLPVAGSISDPAALGGAALAVVLVAGAILLARRLAVPALGILWAFAAAFPTAGPFARADLLSERNLYLPAAGIVLASVGLLLAAGERLPERPRHGRVRIAAVVAGLIVVGVLASSTMRRNVLWSDPVLLWSDAVAKSPRKARAQNNLGYALYLRGDYDAAIERFRLALALDPAVPYASDNLRRAWDARKRATADAGQSTLRYPAGGANTVAAGASLRISTASIESPVATSSIRTV
jgi:tetratricopeptide (TPR) repeat protein